MNRRMIWAIGAAVLFYCAVVVCVSIATAEGQTLYIGTGKTEDKPQSKLWYHDGAWWAILPTGNGLYFHRMESGLFVTQTFPHALVDRKNSARADVLSEKGRLYVLIYKGTSSVFAEYDYDSSTGIYKRVRAALSVKFSKGIETATIARDTADALWIAYEAGGNIYALRSANHITWSAPVKLNESIVSADDIAAVVSFAGEIGVLWSDQNAGAFYFRVHVDGDPETVWKDREIVAQGNKRADDHIHLSVTPTQDVLAATKSSLDETLYLFVRWYGSSEWSGPFKISKNATRPTVLYDEDNADIYVFYTLLSTVPFDQIVYKRVSLADLASGLQTLAIAPVISVLRSEVVNINNVTSTKDNVNVETDIVIAAKGGTLAYYATVPLTTD